MLSESEKRAAYLAVSRYGADPAQVQRVVDSVLKARSRGDVVDLLDVLLGKNLLAPGHVHELRVGLEKTLVDPLKPKYGADVYAAATLPPPDLGTGDDASAEPIELRALGDYRILRRLGEGGTGAVFLAFDGAVQRQVAIKVLAHNLARSQPALDRFYREGKSGALLNHPNIVRNLASGQDQTTGVHYLVLEFVDGPSALELIDRFGKLTVGDAVHVILDIARALEHAHSRNIVHRDIKPGNILITTSGVAKLADLGLAKRTDEASHLTHAKQGFGTPYYMPYEQAMNAKYADQRSDIFALGATLYHLVTGEVPFPGNNSLEVVDRIGVGKYLAAGELNPSVPLELNRILDKMLARDPHNRYQTASELIVDLERADLAVSVPSFTDPSRAMADPIVRQRLTAPMEATSLDVRQQAAQAVAERQEYWFLRYKDKRGHPCKAKLTSEEVAKRLREGKLTLKVEAARTAQGAYQPLASFEEFAGIAPATERAPAKGRHAHKQPDDRPSASLLDDPVQRLTWWWAACAAGAAILAVVATTLVLLLRD